MMIPDLEINQAVEFLKAGKLVALPTETVYGLGADASNPLALKKIFTAKGRPADHPLIVHIADVVQLKNWVREIPENALMLARAFWPGPLTMIFKKAHHVSDLITGGQDTIGIRIPNHPITQAILKKFAGGVAAPSANRFGRISPTSAEAVREELQNSVDMIVEGGICDVGVESTIVDISGDLPMLLRPGMITPVQIEKVLQIKLKKMESDSPRVSGSLESHYSPVTITQLIATKSVNDFFQKISSDDLPVAFLTYSYKNFQKENVVVFPMSKDAKQYAHDLYDVLRQADKQNFKKIIVEQVPNGSDWIAISDRLQRASAKSDLN